MNLTLQHLKDGVPVSWRYRNGRCQGTVATLPNGERVCVTSGTKCVPLSIVARCPSFRLGKV